MTNWKKEWKPLIVIVGVFLAAFYLPVGHPRFDRAILEAFHLVKWYAQEHVLLCLVPAFFIAGAIPWNNSQISRKILASAKSNDSLSHTPSRLSLNAKSVTELFLTSDTLLFAKRLHFSAAQVARMDPEGDRIHRADTYQDPGQQSRHE